MVARKVVEYDVTWVWRGIDSREYTERVRSSSAVGAMRKARRRVGQEYETKNWMAVEVIRVR